MSDRIVETKPLKRSEQKRLAKLRPMPLPEGYAPQAHELPTSNLYQRQKFADRLEDRDRIIMALRAARDRFWLTYQMTPPTDARKRGHFNVRGWRVNILADRIERCMRDAMYRIDADRMVTKNEKRCKSKACPHCYRKRLMEIREQLVECIDRLKDRRFITLTVRAVDEPLKAQLMELRDSFAMLRNSKLWKECIASDGGALAVVEITVNEQTKFWHPHLHVVFGGRWMNGETLKKLWIKITGRHATAAQKKRRPKLSASIEDWRAWADEVGASYCTDIKQMEADALGDYLTKHVNLERYLTKGAALDNISDDQLAEWASETHGLRFLSTYGSLWGRDLEEIAEHALQDLEERKSSINLGSVNLLKERAAAGDADAQVIDAGLERSYRSKQPLPPESEQRSWKWYRYNDESRSADEAAQLAQLHDEFLNRSIPPPSARSSTVDLSLFV